jgi:hypothetical protein
MKTPREMSNEPKPDAQARVPFKLRCASFKGDGLQAEFLSASWDQLLEAAYRGRGA